MSLILVCDLGGSSLRVALVDEAGSLIALRASPMPQDSETIGRSEADPALWWQCFEALAADLLAEVGPARVAAVAITAFTRTQVLVGRDGEALRPAILWRDTRSQVHLDELRSLLPEHPESAALNAFHPLSRLFWLKRENPSVYAAATRVLDPKDYLNLRLTGVVASDPISLARLSAAAQPHEGGPSLLTMAGIDLAILPPLNAPASIMGRVRAELAGLLAPLAGVPVVAMANDTWAGVVGLGALRAGLGYNLSGTTEVFGIIDQVRLEAAGLLSVDWRGGEAGGCWQLGGPSQAGGDTILWLLELLAGRAVGPKGSGAALDALLDGPRQPDPVLFLPHLEGERTPYWDPSLRGAFLGLNRRHGPTDLAFAVLEGIAFLNRLVLERAEAAVGRPIAELRFGGGGAANARWRGIKADVLDRPVACVQGEEHGLQGAAIAAWTALGRFPDLAAAQEALVRVGDRRAPRPEERARYDRLYGLFLQAEAALAPLSRRLADFDAR